MPQCALRWRTEKFGLGSCRRVKKKTAIPQSRAGLSSVTAVDLPTTVTDLADLPSETVSSLEVGGARDAPVRLIAGPQLNLRGPLATAAVHTRPYGVAPQSELAEFYPRWH